MEMKKRPNTEGLCSRVHALVESPLPQLTA